MSIRFNMERERQWLTVHNLGFTPADVTELVKHYKKGIADGKRNLGALKLDNFTAKFEDDLILYRMAKPAPAERGMVSSKTPALPAPVAPEQRVEKTDFAALKSRIANLKRPDSL